MKNLVLLICVSVLASAAFAGDGRIIKHKKKVKDSYIVVLNPVAAADVERVARQLIDSYAVKVSKRTNDGADSIFRYAFQGFSGTMPESTAVELASDPRVLLVEENGIGDVSAVQTFTENDPHYNLDRIDQSGPVTPGNRQYIYQTAGSGVYIYVLDSGVRRNHFEFDDDNSEATPQVNPRVVDGVTFVPDGFPAWDPCGNYVGDYRSGTHGTAVASVAAGKTVGVAKNAFIVPIKVIGCNGETNLEWWCWGMDWIVGPANSYRYDSATGNQRPAVANVSLFMDTADPNRAGTPFGTFEHAVQSVVTGGIAVIASANNQDNPNCTTVPARLGYGNAANHPSNKRVITVGGTDEFDRLWRCANFGDCGDPGSNTGPCVDLYAPAHDLKVAWMNGYQTYRTRASQRSGTSFSAPAVAGIAARILQSNSTLTPEQLWDAIRLRAKPLPANFDGDGVPANDRIAYIGVLE